MESPRSIIKLDPVVINRIAAGEVVHRPSNAIKELMENSIDAGSTQITITVHQGGLKLIQIQDNGKGIKKEDLGIVCERFTTSKLTKYEDLESIQSFGFRGEALASISHVSNVTILSKAVGQKCAYKAVYLDGMLHAPAPGKKAEPLPCAGNQGTLITVENLFYNMKVRKQSLKNTSEEYQRILDIVSKYAVHYGSKNIAFTCKKYRQTSPDLCTPSKSTCLDNIKRIFGRDVGKELIEFKCQLNRESSTKEDAEHNIFECDGYISNANYNLKKSNSILFINDRLVSCSTLTRAVEQVYANYLPKHTHPFLYLALRLPGHNVDVNVHPTKKEVQFLFEEEIIEKISTAIEESLKGANASRTFMTNTIPSFHQTTLAAEPSTFDTTSQVEIDVASRKRSRGQISCQACNHEEDSHLSVMPSSSTDPICVQVDTPIKSKYNPSKVPQKLVRTDHTSSTMDAFINSESRLKIRDGNENTTNNTGNTDPVVGTMFKLLTSVRSKDLPSHLQLTSVNHLLDFIETRKSKALMKMFKDHTFVGVVDESFSLIQYTTKLYMVRHQVVLKEFFYQQVIQRFGVLPTIEFTTPLPIVELASMALDAPISGWTEEDGPKEALAREICDVLSERRDLLHEYFSLTINEHDELVAVPDLLHGYDPDVSALPEFLLRLATEVNWEDEQPCFDNVASEVAQWYSNVPLAPLVPSKEGINNTFNTHPHNHLLMKELFSTCLRGGGGGEAVAFVPPLQLKDSAIIMEVACLTRLYRIFERC